MEFINDQANLAPMGFKFVQMKDQALFKGEMAKRNINGF